MAQPLDKSTLPTVSYVGEDGCLAEILYDPVRRQTSFAVFRDGDLEVASSLETPGGVLVPYLPNNNLIATRCVLLPSDVGERASKDELLHDIGRYLRRYVDLSASFELIAAHYVLLSWVYEAFNELPYLRFRGDYGTGKTRALMTIGSLCYKPFFASGASTVSPIFHVLDAFRGSLILDEADLRFSDATADLTKILNNGNAAGLPVLRTMANQQRELNPRAFSVFGPKLLGMREGFSDVALESRFLTEETGGRPLRGDIPISLPPSLADEATDLRNRLLRWRFETLASVGPCDDRLVEGLEPRLNQIGLPLLSLIDDPGARLVVAGELERQQARVSNERAGAIEATMLRVLVTAFEETQRPFVSISEATRRYNDATVDHFTLPISPKQVGTCIRKKLRLVTTRLRGVYVVPQSERGRINALAKRWGVVSPQEIVDG